MRSTLVMCVGCRRFGHVASECPTKAVYTPEQLEDVRCLACGVHGHLNCALTKQRALRLFCYNCGQRGHFGEDCHRPGMDPLTQKRIVASSMAIHERSAVPAGGGGGGVPGFGPGWPSERFRRHSTSPSLSRAAIAGAKPPRDELECADRLFFAREAEGSQQQRGRLHGGARAMRADSAPARVRAPDGARGRSTKPVHGNKRPRAADADAGAAPTARAVAAVSAKVKKPKGTSRAFAPGRKRSAGMLQ
ncbi:hypothetical protein KFE25_009966 [Diacronema lutheri]|uniref:CCHC-type domain-containing protein n=1 Tax=Diacronema lutheri TaxID=2081491 RepID=A0A8J5XD87_DIALT|nr:hypothetical protein KFE25_009966 [Diacronema lutheri]